MISVKVEPKNPDHIFYGQGSKGAYTFNGEVNKTLKLVRGCEYKFDVQAPTHPLFFTTSSIGGSKYRDSLMGTGENSNDSGIVTFKIRSDLPETFYYQCWNHPQMGGKVEIIEPSDILKCIF